MAGDETVLLWLGGDLRLGDNPALAAALRRGRVLPVYVLDEQTPGLGPPGAAARWWLHHSLAALAADIRGRGGRLILRRGPLVECLVEAAVQAGAKAVMWNRAVAPDGRAAEERLARRLAAAGIEPSRHAGDLLFAPERVAAALGAPYKRFAPFFRALCRAPPPPPPLPLPRAMAFADAALASENLEAWGLRPAAPDWAAGFSALWTPGEAGARHRWRRFLARRLAAYHEARDYPALEGSSGLSPHLRFGEISARALWHAVAPRAEQGESGAAKFLAELGWREFARHQLLAHPDLAARPLSPAFARLPWREDEAAFAAWRRGETGYPIVDAAMRALWRTGWMHNRLRMIVGSFLVKDLLLAWQKGEAFFRDTLLDADPASNALGWQWVAGSGFDAQPFFRIFNPVTQGERYDPDGAFVRRWCPELAALDSSVIHKPWQASPAALARAGLVLGRDYPAPIVDHAAARTRALAALKATRRRA